MKISEMEFVEAIDNLKQQSDFDHSFSVNMEKAFPGCYPPIYEGKQLSNYYKLLPMIKQRLSVGGYMKLISEKILINLYLGRRTGKR